MEGKITRIAYEVPKGRSTFKVYRQFRERLQAGQVSQTVNADDVVNFWNNGFAQRHLSAKSSRREGDVYLSLHVPWNLDGAPVAQVDTIEMKPMATGLVTVNSESLAGDIRRTGHTSAYGIYSDTGKAEVEQESNLG